MHNFIEPIKINKTWIKLSKKAYGISSNSIETMEIRMISASLRKLFYSMNMNRMSGSGVKGSPLHWLNTHESFVRSDCRFLQPQPYFRIHKILKFNPRISFVSHFIDKLPNGVYIEPQINSPFGSTRQNRLARINKINENVSQIE